MPRKKNRRQHGEGSVYQRKDGRWCAEIHLGYKPNGGPNRRYFYGSTPDEAIEARDEFRRDQEDGYTPQPGQKRWRVGPWLWHYLDTICTANENTKYKYKSLIRNMEPHIGRGWLDEISEEPIETMNAALRRKGLSGEPLSQTTLSQINRFLHAALKAAVVRRATTKLRRNPCDNVSVPVGEPPEIIPPEEPEVELVLAAADARPGGARWSVALGLGTRQGESLGLLWDLVDIRDLDEASAKIHWELIRLPREHGCEDPHACGATHHRYPCPPGCAKAARTSGRRHICVTASDPKLCPKDCTGHARSCPQATGGLVLTPPKSQKSKRTVPLVRPLAERLKKHRAQQKETRLALGEKWRGWAHDPAECPRRARPREVVCPACRRPMRSDALVFANPDGTPIDPRRDWQAWTDLLDDLGLAHYRVHDMRHFTATLLLHLGVDRRIVQEIVGHSDAAFTQKQYQFVSLELQREALAKASKRLWSADG